jgi:hypothetical protein
VDVRDHVVVQRHARAPRLVAPLGALHARGDVLAVAAQVAFEKSIFETSFSLHRLKG